MPVEEMEDEAVAEVAVATPEGEVAVDAKLVAYQVTCYYRTVVTMQTFR